jgi:hypothetical protein
MAVTKPDSARDLGAREANKAGAGPADLARPVAGDRRPPTGGWDQAGAWPAEAARAGPDTGLAWFVSALLALSVAAGVFLGLLFLDLVNFEPVTAVHLGLAGAVAPLTGAFYRGLRRLGW